MNLVSVYIPTHNRAHLIERAVLSVINQTYKSIEIIIVDDGSTDKTQEVLQELCSRFSNIKLLRHEKAKGACAARNLAIENAKGVYVTGLDDDDEFQQHRIMEFVKHYKSEYSLLCSTLVVNDRFGVTKTVSNKRIISYEDIKNRNYVGGHIFVERERLTNSFSYSEDMPAWQDYDLSFRLIKEYGPALKLNNYSYCVDVCSADDRISDSEAAFDGFRMFIERHKDELTEDQINNHRVNDLYNRRVKLSLLQSLKYVRSFYTFKRLGLLYLLVKQPKIYKYIVAFFSALNNLSFSYKN